MFDTLTILPDLATGSWQCIERDFSKQVWHQIPVPPWSAQTFQCDLADSRPAPSVVRTLGPFSFQKLKSC